MMDINENSPPKDPAGEPLAKAHPAQALLRPAWRCPKCQQLNAVTDAFCACEGVQHG